MQNMSDGFTKRPEYLNEWEYFVIRHQHVGNLVFHFISWILWVASLVLTLCCFHWVWLCVFIISPAVGVMGHHLYNDGKVRSADFIRPQTLLYLSFIFVLIVLGRYKDISEQAFQKVRQH